MNLQISCLNFWDEAWWFLSLRVFGLLPSSLLFFSQGFGRYVLRSSSGVCCQNFWDEAWWFLSLRVFGLLSLSLLLFSKRFGRYVLWPSSGICCLNFWDEAWWFLSLRVFGLLSPSLLLFSQRFGRYVLRSSSGVCRIQYMNGVRQTPEEGRRTYPPKCCENNNKDEDNCPKTPNDKKNLKDIDWVKVFFLN